jgi:rod shape-determining protein MreB
VDLGTANTLVHVRGHGIVVREPSVIATTGEGQILAVGEAAKRMIGRTPADISATRPLRGGVIAEFAITVSMLSYFLKKAVPARSILRPRVVVGIPSDATTVEKRALIEAAVQAGAGDAFLIEEPLAAALGVGLPVAEPIASMVVDIGGGRTQVAVITLGGIVTCRSIRMAGDNFDDAIIAYARRAYNLMIGERTAEEAKIAIGSALSQGDEDPAIHVRGRDLVSGLPRTLRITATEIRDALAEPLQAIVEAVRQTLEATPPELAADLVGRGLTLVGGGALLRGLDRLIIEATGMQVHMTDDPLSAVAMGTGMAFDGIDTRNAHLTSKNV